MRGEGRSPETLVDRAEFRRFVWASALAHALLVGVVLFGPGLRGPSVRAPIFVDLIAPPRPKPAPARPAPVRQTVEQAVVLKPKPQAKPEPRAEPTPQPETEKKPAPTAAEVLARLREQVGEEPEARPASETAAARSAGSGRVDPLLAAYDRRIKALLFRNWGGLAVFRGEQGLRAEFEVELDARGAIRSVSQTRASGNRFFDESAERAVRRSDPFPAPPRGPLTLVIGFEPRGVF